MNRKTTSLLGAIVAFGLIVPGLAVVASAKGKYSHEIDVVEHGAMLVEKMAKEAALLALGINSDENHKALQASHDEFQRILKGLRDGDAGLNLAGNPQEDSIKKRLAAVEAAWPVVDKEVKETVASAKPSAALLEHFEEHDEVLYQAVEDLEHAYVKEAHTGDLPSAFAEGVEYTEHQATLIERMSKEYFLIAHGFHNDEMRAELKESIDEFQKHMTGLLEGSATLSLLPAPTPEIEAQLKKVAGLWKSFREHLDPVAKGGAPSPEHLAAVDATNLHIVDEIEKAAKLYEEL